MFWTRDFSVLLNEPFDFVPTPSQTKDERLNSITRLAIYSSLALSVIKKDIKYMWILVIVIAFTVILDKYKTSIDYMKNTYTSEWPFKFTVPRLDPNEKAVPTIDNPFMNATLGEYLKTDKDGNVLPKPEALNISDPDVKKVVEDLFEKGSGAPRSIGDFYNKEFGLREFYTNPSTSIPGNREDFQNWLYKVPARCKEQSDCFMFEDLRGKRPIFVNQFENSDKASGK